MVYYPQQTSYNNGGMFQSIPPNPIGNISPIGFGGYNNGYYTGNYNQFNPYAIQQQRELQLAQQREVQRNESTIFKKLHKASCSYNEFEIKDEDLRRYDPSFEQQNNDIEGLNQNELDEYYSLLRQDQYKQNQQQFIIQMQMQPQMPYINPIGVAYANAYYEINQKAKKEIPNDVGLVEYLEKYAPKQYIEALEYESRKSQADLTKLYNKTDYNKLLNMHKTSLFGDVFNPDATIDDQEIRLPNLISQKTRQERRKQFLDTIMNGGGM